MRRGLISFADGIACRSPAEQRPTPAPADLGAVHPGARKRLLAPADLSEMDLSKLEANVAAAIERASGEELPAGAVRIVKVTPASIEVTMEVYPDSIVLTALEPAGRGHELYEQAVERANEAIYGEEIPGEAVKSIGARPVADGVR